MGTDPLSPIAPARVRALLLPVGKVRRSRFTSFVQRLQPENVVRLGDVSPDRRPNRTMFSPLAFPTGMIVYDLSTSLPPSTQVGLSPFELFRQPLIIIGVTDDKELGPRSEDAHGDFSDAAGEPTLSDMDQMLNHLDHLRESYPAALAHQILLFDYDAENHHDPSPEGIIAVPPPEQSRTTTIKTVMCDLTSCLLAEFTTFAKSLQGLPSIDSPTASQPAHRASTYAAWQTEQTRGQPLGGLVDSHGSRSESPADVAKRVQQRMSMPARVPSTTNAQHSSSSTPQPTSPPDEVQNPPVSDLEDSTGATDRNLTENTVSRSSAGSTVRVPSQDRVSVQGFGSGSLSERARNKGKGRVGIIVGTLYLNAGRWPDAVRELVESACIAKANIDHLWHAKALENILVCLLMLAWAGMDFQIPQICYPNADKSSTSSSVKSPHHTPTNSSSDVSSAQSTNVANRLVSLQNLTNLLPDFLGTILNLYSRSTGESLPQIAFSECVIRFAKLLTAMHLCSGRLDDHALRHVVLSASSSRPANLATPRLNIVPTRTEINTILFRAFPSSTNADLGITDRTIILAGIASVLSSLGFFRKKALVLKEMVAGLIPGLVQARKIGAAEMGVHPAAGLAAINAISGWTGSAGALNLNGGDIESGIEPTLGMLGTVYGVVAFKSSLTNDPHLNLPENNRKAAKSDSLCIQEEDSDQEIIARILQNSTLRSFGSRNLKMDLLRSCINLCEALPDFHGVVRFTSELLRTAGSGIAPSPDSSDGSALLAREEQIRLSTNISRTIGAAKKLGLEGVEAEYWDDFLLRGIEVQTPASWRTPIPHARSELDDAGAIEEKKEKSPFIYNPFLKKPSVTAIEPLLVSGEQADFRVTLQNPYDFDVDIERVRLESRGVEFESTQQGVVMGPYRTQTIFLSGTPRSSGSLIITGCFIKVRGCRERRYPIFTKAWSPERATKVKKMGLLAANRRMSRPSASEANPMAKGSVKSSDPKPSSVELNVVPEQPIVVIKSTSLSQASIMILEGETKTFTITLQNLSTTTSVDLILLSFQDSTAAPLQAAMNNKNLSPTELYELELLFSQKQAFRWRQKGPEIDPSILPGGTAQFEIEVLGKPGLTSGIVQVDYTHLGIPRSDVRDRFYTRQVTIPITITVNASVELVRVDLLPFTGDFAFVNQQRKQLANGSAEIRNPHHNRQRTVSRPIVRGENRFQSLFARLGVGLQENEYCLLLLDLRNAWPHPLSISLQVREHRTYEETFEDTWKRAYTVHEILQPGHVSRLVLLLPKIYLKNPHAPIPALNPKKQRQFVVSASKMSPEVERAARESFWFKEEILNHVRGSWEEDGVGRTGEMELRGLRLSARMVDALRVEDVSIDLAIVASTDETDKLVRQTGRSKFEVSTDEFLTLRTQLTNRSQQSIYPLLRLQPSLRNQPHNIALDLSKRFAWNGLLQRPLPLLAAGQTTEVDLGICVLCKGEFEVSASIEEVRLWKPSLEKADAEGGRARADTNLLLANKGIGERERRIWHAREVCVIIARDDDPNE
ncbi:MAG: hypothetical protein M1812_003800 [Candelaria pacifica]|nr:MAG: hypothetical protein M1812_003800 [Candelaria pacifica]